MTGTAFGTNERGALGRITRRARVPFLGSTGVFVFIIVNVLVFIEVFASLTVN
jgi:hypothetical protein